MKIEDQLCDLEYAKRLEELGVRQNGYFSYYGKNLKSKSDVVIDLKSFGMNCYGEIDVVSAFTVSELGAMLPFKIIIGGHQYYYATGKTSKDDKYYSEHDVNYVNYGDEGCLCLEIDKNEANARAKMLIYLIEKDLVKVEDL